jgi:hypothetical protein
MGAMIRSLVKKIFRPWSKNASRRVSEERAEQREDAEELTPGHSDRATQIGVFH